MMSQSSRTQATMHCESLLLSASTHKCVWPGCTECIATVDSHNCCCEATCNGVRPLRLLVYHLVEGVARGHVGLPSAPLLREGRQDDGLLQPASHVRVRPQLSAPHTKSSAAVQHDIAHFCRLVAAGCVEHGSCCRVPTDTRQVRLPGICRCPHGGRAPPRCW
jgi:hypothetical protein